MFSIFKTKIIINNQKYKNSFYLYITSEQLLKSKNKNILPLTKTCMISVFRLSIFMLLAISFMFEDHRWKFHIFQKKKKIQLNEDNIYFLVMLHTQFSSNWTDVTILIGHWSASIKKKNRRLMVLSDQSSEMRVEYL